MCETCELFHIDFFKVDVVANHDEGLRRGPAVL